MIGIRCEETEREIVHEFFELFKTPWEFWIPGHCYSVIISTLYEAPDVNAKLLIIFSSECTEFDDLEGVSVEPSVSEYIIGLGEDQIPIYVKLSRLCGRGKPLHYGQTHSEAVSVGFSSSNRKIIRAGYDLFREVAFLLSEGQPIENARLPTLDAHISLLRAWIVEAGVPVIEIPPIPRGYEFIACLTHDVDFVGIRRHKLDHTFWGFVYRALVGSFIGFVRGKDSLTQLLRNWIAVFSLPFVYLGLVEDFWDQFAGYAAIDRDFSSTFFLIPFRDRAGATMPGRPLDYRRATRYDIRDVHKQIAMLMERGYEIGLHGIDAWHCAEKGEQELKRIVEVTGQERVGVRMHCLYFERRSPSMLEQAGFDYDSTYGYNETVGYKAGTSQAFQPLGMTRLLELPLHIQDTALFSLRRMALTEAQAWDLCMTIIAAAAQYGGVITVLWHLRSLAPERLWGEFYVRLLQELRNRGAWFGTAEQVVQWFRQRRSVLFEESHFTEGTLRLRLGYKGDGFEPRLFLRVHRPERAGPMDAYARPTHLDVPWTGQPCVEISLE